MAEFRLLPALLAAVALAIPEAAVQAFPAAPLEADSRPCFETLPDPAISLWCGYGRYHHHGWGRGYRIMCERARPGAVTWALEHMRPGATLVLVGGARPCRDSVIIRKPVTIVGEPGWLSGARVPTLQPFEGRPCVVVEAGAGQVTLSNLLISSEHGEAPCIAQHNRELTLDRTWVRYDGAAPAVLVDGGRLIARGSVIATRSLEPAVNVHGGVEMDGSSVLATSVGMVVDALEDVRLRGVNIERLDDWSGSERVKGSIGLAFVRSQGAQPKGADERAFDIGARERLNQVDGAMIEGFSRGVYSNGGQELVLQNVTVHDSEYGVLSEGARLRVNRSEIEAVDAGIYAAAGEAWAAENRIFGVRRAGLFVEKGKARLFAKDNLVFADKDGCQALAVEGLDPDAQSCRPWFEAPEFYRTGRLSGRPAFDDVWPDSRGSVSTRPGF
jgi:hypothetical protein